MNGQQQRQGSAFDRLSESDKLWVGFFALWLFCPPAGFFYTLGLAWWKAPWLGALITGACVFFAWYLFH